MGNDCVINQEKQKWCSRLKQDSWWSPDLRSPHRLLVLRWADFSSVLSFPRERRDTPSSSACRFPPPFPSSCSCSAERASAAPGLGHYERQLSPSEPGAPPPSSSRSPGAWWTRPACRCRAAGSSPSWSSAGARGKASPWHPIWGRSRCERAAGGCPRGGLWGSCKPAAPRRRWGQREARREPCSERSEEPRRSSRAGAWWDCGALTTQVCCSQRDSMLYQDKDGFITTSQN